VDDKPLFEVRCASKSFRRGRAAPVRALHDVSLTIPRGSLTVLAGHSGSGKTTLLALLGALDRPSAGQVLFQGIDLGSCSDVALTRVRRRMGFVFQDFSLIPGLSAWENVASPLVPQGVRYRARRERARQQLAQLGLGERLLARPGELSGGEQQRVALARALVVQPEVILGDEPTSNLDREAATLVLGLLRDFHAAGGTVVLTSHEPEARSMATQLIVLQGGRLVPAACDTEGR
jgi:putative ABC transport system ATP-binding protein